jgi:hypothetical protein
MCNCNQSKELKLFVSYKLVIPKTNILHGGLRMGELESKVTDVKTEFIDISFNDTNDPTSYEIQREITKEILRIENVDDYHDVIFVNITQFKV